jgi:glutamate N-acetyltransferase/amino-acid N-acetyltransferase
MIARDGEGATKFIEVEVTNACCVDDAVLIGKSISGSNLFKTAMFGQDANWGRIIAAAGYSGAEFDPGKVNIWLESASGKEQTTKNGEGLPFDENKALQILKEKDIKVIVDLQQGNADALVWTCDFSYEYVRINADYRS